MSGRQSIWTVCWICSNCLPGWTKRIAPNRRKENGQYGQQPPGSDGRGRGMNRAELERYIAEIYSTQGGKPLGAVADQYRVPASPQPEVVCHYHGHSQRKAGASRRWHYFRGECQMRSPADRLLPGRTGNFPRVSHEQSPLADRCSGRQRGGGETQIPAGYEL